MQNNYQKMLSFSALQNVSVQQFHGRGKRFFASAKPICKVSSLAPTKAPSIGLEDLLETLTVDVEKAESKSLKLALKVPITLSSSKVDVVENVGIRLELSNGCSGWGEIAVSPSNNGHHEAVSDARLACEGLVRRPSMSLGSALYEIEKILPGPQMASVRSGVEMALIDAAARSIGLPLWRLFGGASDTVVTGITIPIATPYEAAGLAGKHLKQGFKTLKIKLRNDLNSDVEVLEHVIKNRPECTLILEGNEKYNPEEAIQLIGKLREIGVQPLLFKQPVRRDDWEGLRYVTRAAKKYGVPIAADESCCSAADARRITEENLADVIEVKLAKNGVMGALEITKLARKAGMEVAIGGMIETRVAAGFAGHLAAGLGCFKFVHLESPLLLAEDPVFGGYEVSGSVYKLTNVKGHAGFLHWDR